MEITPSKKLKKILRPFFVALILIVFVFASAAKIGKNNSPLTLPETVSSQSVFADPSQRYQPELPEFLLLHGNSFKSTYPSFTVTPKVFGALIGGLDFTETQNVIKEYVIESGDSLWSVSAKFDVSINTLLWANDLSKATIQPGQKLIIPPVSGVIHHVRSGDTVGEIARKYKANSKEIVSFNDLSGEADIYIGDILIVPDGQISIAQTTLASAQIPTSQSYFICPIALPCRITQGLHWYNAIDFSHGRCGDTIYAAAAGTVLKVKLTNSTSPWVYSGAGSHITVLHPNGVTTMYGHVSASFVNPGDNVYQGQPIALMGGQPGTPGAGMSTGCHLHFGVTGTSNPFAY